MDSERREALAEALVRLGVHGVPSAGRRTADALYRDLLDDWFTQERAEALREAAEDAVPRFNVHPHARTNAVAKWLRDRAAALAPSTPRRAEPGVQDCAVKVWGNSDDEQFPCPRPAALEWLDLTGNWVPICKSHAGRGLPADRLRPLRAEPGVQGSDGGEDREPCEVCGAGRNESCSDGCSEDVDCRDMP